MDTTIKIQFYIFLTSLYGGLIAGLAYDFYRINRYYFKPKKIVTLIEDFLFWVSLALIFFYILNRSNWAELRGYVFLGFFSGGLIYLKILSKLLLPIMVKFINKLTIILRKFCTIVVLLLKSIGRSLSPKIKKVKRISRIPKEAIREIKRYKSILSKKK